MPGVSMSVLDRIDVDPITGEDRVTYTPVPFGPDMFAQFGDDYALPVVGNFDPPVPWRHRSRWQPAHQP